MDSRKRKRIGVILGNLDSPHAYELAKGMSHAAEDKNINLLVFPGMHSKSSYDREMSLHKVEYDYQFNTIYDLAIKEDIDAIVVSMGTVADFLSSNEIESFLDKFSKIPTLILEEDIHNEFCMRYNNKSGLKECIKHLILEHGYKRIAYISGSLNNHDAIERLAVYRETMHEYDLPYEESMIVYGNFTEYLDDKVGKLLDCHIDLEAIVCANDMMAVGVYKELKRRGMVVGKDIAVTGFDDYVVAMSMDPPLTTVRVNPYSFGYRALLEADKIADGEKISSYQVDSTLVVRSSCGCRAISENQLDFAFGSGYNEALIEYYSD
ncbi:MAG: LacI family transcriptional regulator, partial [Clostridiales bacterium]|nr:LacI family transcriptional regulator [Clostridiales bacterium]